MNPSRIAYGLWNRVETDKSHAELLKMALDAGVQTFITSDSLSGGEAERNLGEAIRGADRESLSLVGCIGYDTCGGTAGSGYSSSKARFTSRDESEYKSYVESAVKATLERLGTDYLDVLLFQDPDRSGFRSQAVWDAFAKVKDLGMVKAVGIAPGPANGYSIDLLHCFDQFGDILDWAMVVYNPLESWPGELVLKAAEERGIQLIARESAIPGGPNAPAAKAERAARKQKIDEEICDANDTSIDALWSLWSQSAPGVKCVAPPMPGTDEWPIEARIQELAELKNAEASESLIALFPRVQEIGSTKGQIQLKGGTQQFQGHEQAEQWPMDDELRAAAAKHGIELDRDYFMRDDPRDLRDFGMPKRGVPQAIDRRLYIQLQVFDDVQDRNGLIAAMEQKNVPAVVYADLNAPNAVGVLLWSEDPLELSANANELYGWDWFQNAEHRPDFTMLGRSYGFGREDDVEYWLTQRPIDSATYPNRPWAVWYPLRRSSNFYRQPAEEQRAMLLEHGIIGHHFGSAGYATDIRLECFGIDANDNEFVLGILSERLDWLSRLVKKMRGTRQTSEFMDSLGPFFVGHTIYQNSGD